MEKTNWWKKAVVYQIYPKSFRDSDGDGIGDLRGIIEKLDYLEYLGIDVIWISPFFKSPMVDNGYDISDYYQVDEMFGKNDDLFELIERAKTKGIKILFDLVVNHCSDQHAWFQKAVQDPTSKERDYFIIKKKAEITNWRGIFGGSCWTLLPGSQDEYYFHVFAKEQPDLNWENPALRSEIYDMINYWLDRGIGGFRVDAISYLKKNQAYPNFEPDGLDGLAHVDKGSINQKGIDQFLQEMRAATFDRYDCMTVGEACGVPFEDLGIYVGDKGCFSMIFEFSYDHPSIPKQANWYEYQDWQVDDWKKQIFAAQAAIEKVGWSPSHVENHDGARAVNRFLEESQISYESATMIAAIYFNLRGTPFIYQGQEIGMTNVHYASIDDYDDLSTKDHFERALAAGFPADEALRLIAPRSRDNARSPMQWSADPQAGFSETTPWLAVNDNYQRINVEAEIKREKSVLQFYRKMIQLRKNPAYEAVLTLGKFKPLYQENKNIVAYERNYQNQRVWVITNFQATGQSILLTAEVKLLLNNYPDVKIENSQLWLAPYQSLIVEVVATNE